VGVPSLQAQLKSQPDRLHDAEEIPRRATIQVADRRETTLEAQINTKNETPPQLGRHNDRKRNHNRNRNHNYYLNRIRERSIV
jgi:hypothetical protein